MNIFNKKIPQIATGQKISFLFVNLYTEKNFVEDHKELLIKATFENKNKQTYEEIFDISLNSRTGLSFTPGLSPTDSFFKNNGRKLIENLKGKREGQWM